VNTLLHYLPLRINTSQQGKRTLYLLLLLMQQVCQILLVFVLLNFVMLYAKTGKKSQGRLFFNQTSLLQQKID
jgi:hypothetical protein